MDVRVRTQSQLNIWRFDGQMLSRMHGRAGYWFYYLIIFHISHNQHSFMSKIYMMDKHTKRILSMINIRTHVEFPRMMYIGISLLFVIRYISIIHQKPYPEICQLITERGISMNIMIWSVRVQDAEWSMRSAWEMSWRLGYGWWITTHARDSRERLQSAPCVLLSGVICRRIRASLRIDYLFSADDRSGG